MPISICKSWKTTCSTFTTFMALRCMHDSAPCYKARRVTKYLERKQINILEWPGNSPDLNSIENCWYKMKKTMSEKKTTNLGTLKEKLKKMWWQEMIAEYFRNLSGSIPKRLQMVIKN